MSAMVERLARIEFRESDDDPIASIPVPGGSIEITDAGEVDTAAADQRRDRQRQQIELQIERASAKLANSGFVDRAPPAVVEAEREKIARLEAELKAL